MNEPGFAFEHALISLKKGKRVMREGWNGKGMYLVYMRGSRADTGPTDTHGDWQANENIFPLTMERLPFLAMKTADNKVVPWLASQTDILAGDWHEVE